MESTLSLAQKAAVTVGADDWHTVELPGVIRLTLCDGPVGVRCEDPTSPSPDDFNKHDSYPATCLPCGAAVGASWNPDAVRYAAAGIAAEAKALGVDVLLGPAMNHKRTPLGGRNFEYISEDPILTGTLAAAYVEGVQSRGVAACVKHFCLNNTEYNRLTIDIEVDEDVLRDVYLKGFEIAVKSAAPLCLMGAYVRVDGQYCCEHERLLTSILRGEWGYTGTVVSDWRAVHDRVAALQAGCDLEMPFVSERSAESVVQAVQTGELEERTLDVAVNRIRSLREATAVCGDAPDPEAVYLAARTLAEESAVLLKNDGILPLVGKRVAVIGGRAKAPKYQGGGSARLNARHVTNLYDELSKRMPVTYAEGFTAGETDDALLAEAERVAKAADVAIVCLSSPASDDAEDRDRPSMSLEAGAYELVGRLVTTGTPIVLVLQSGAPVAIPCRDTVAAILETFLAGSGGGEATARILTGEVNPSGKLAETYPERYEDCPAAAYYATDPDRMRYGEGFLTGYRYYRTKRVPTAYPFGFGLSYTSFRYDSLSVEAAGEEVVCTVRVTNAGERGGKETVQIYAHLHDGVERELIGYRKEYIPVGETATVTVRVPRERLAVWKDGKTVARDCCEIIAAPHSEAEGVKAAFSKSCRYKQ